MAMDASTLPLDVQMRELGIRARRATAAIALAAPETRTRALRAIAANLRASAAGILAANADDVARAKRNALAESFIDRLTLDPKRLEGVAAGVDAVAAI